LDHGNVQRRQFNRALETIRQGFDHSRPQNRLRALNDETCRYARAGQNEARDDADQSPSAVPLRAFSRTGCHKNSNSLPQL
jgi:hypothetical protein